MFDLTIFTDCNREVYLKLPRSPSDSWDAGLLINWCERQLSGCPPGSAVGLWLILLQLDC